jgi:hypothetical protein
MTKQIDELMVLANDVYAHKNGAFDALRTALEAALKECRDITLEECAENLDEWGNASSVAYIGSGAKTAATRIRSMKT